MAAQKKENIKVRDLKPKKDAKGGTGGRGIMGTGGGGKQAQAGGGGRVVQVFKGQG